MTGLLAALALLLTVPGRILGRRGEHDRPRRGRHSAGCHRARWAA